MQVLLYHVHSLSNSLEFALIIKKKTLILTRQVSKSLRNVHSSPVKNKKAEWLMVQVIKLC